MCNHYRTGQHALEFSETRIPGVRMSEALSEIREHIYPKYLAPVVVQENGGRHLVSLPWGVPVTMTGTGGKRFTKPVTNARNDKLTGYTWRYATQERRCLIPATGYFEPGQGPVGAKGEILFTVRERPAFFFAGLWEPHAEGRAFTLVTTEPNEFVAQFHDRMPVVLADDDALAWLGDKPLADELLPVLCRGLPAEALHHEALPPKLKIAKLPAKTPPPEDGLF